MQIRKRNGRMVKIEVEVTEVEVKEVEVEEVVEEEEVVEAEEETQMLTMKVSKLSLINHKEVEEEEVVEVEAAEEIEAIEEIEVIEVDLKLPQDKSKQVEKKLVPEEVDLKAQESTLLKPSKTSQPRNEISDDMIHIQPPYEL